MKGTPKLILLTLGAGALIWVALLASGSPPAQSLLAIIQSSVTTPAGWRETLKEMTPLLLAGLAIFIALRAGLFNIGAEGQIMMGALAGVAVALVVTGPVGIVLSLLAAMVAGAVWALPAALIKVYRGGHEVISTIMLNSIAGFLCLWLVKGPLRDKAQQSTTTALIDASTHLPDIYRSGPFRLNLAWVIGVVVVVLAGLWLKKTVAGYELQATGDGERAAEFAGVNTRRTLIGAMSLSGALSGLAGGLMVLGYEHRFFADFSSGYGFDALGVAFLAGRSVPGLFGASLVFAVINKGVTSLPGVSKGLTGIVLGLLILVFAAWRSRRLAEAAA